MSVSEASIISRLLAEEFGEKPLALDESVDTIGCVTLTEIKAFLEARGFEGSVSFEDGQLVITPTMKRIGFSIRKVNE